jgi:hypothetical protein
MKLTQKRTRTGKRQKPRVRRRKRAQTALKRPWKKGTVRKRAHPHSGNSRKLRLLERLRTAREALLYERSLRDLEAREKEFKQHQKERKARQKVELEAIHPKALDRSIRIPGVKSRVWRGFGMIDETKLRERLLEPITRRQRRLERLEADRIRAQKQARRYYRLGSSWVRDIRGLAAKLGPTISSSFESKRSKH